MTAQTQSLGEADLVGRVVLILVQNKVVPNAIVYNSSICIQRSVKHEDTGQQRTFDTDSFVTIGLPPCTRNLIERSWKVC